MSWDKDNAYAVLELIIQRQKHAHYNRRLTDKRKTCTGAPYVSPTEYNGLSNTRRDTADTQAS